MMIVFNSWNTNGWNEAKYISGEERTYNEYKNEYIKYVWKWIQIMFII